MKEERSPEKLRTKAEILTRLAEIDKILFGLSESLPHAGAEFQESHSGDDDATESQPLEQKLAEIRREREELQAEQAALHARLAELDKAA